MFWLLLACATSTIDTDTEPVSSDTEQVVGSDTEVQSESDTQVQTDTDAESESDTDVEKAFDLLPAIDERLRAPPQSPSSTTVNSRLPDSRVKVVSPSW